MISVAGKSEHVVGPNQFADRL